MWKIGLLCPSDDELAPFLPHLEKNATLQKAMLTIYEGQLCGVPVAALYSGVCKVNAALATQILIDTCGVNGVINAGVAGGIDPAVQLFDTVVSTQAAYHDVAADVLTEFHPWLPTVYFGADEELLNAAKRCFGNDPSVHFGSMVTGEAFIEDGAPRARIIENFHPLCVDMETAAVAHACHVNGVPFLAVRAISDTAAHVGLQNFEQNCRQASEAAKNRVLALLNELNR